MKTIKYLSLTITVLSILCFCTSCKTEQESKNSNSTTVTTTTQTKEVQTTEAEKENKTLTSSEAKEIAKAYIKDTFEEYDCVIGTVDFCLLQNGKEKIDTIDFMGDWHISVKGNCKIPDDYGHIHTVDFEAKVLVNAETGNIDDCDIVE